MTKTYFPELKKFVDKYMQEQKFMEGTVSTKHIPYVLGTSEGVPKKQEEIPGAFKAMIESLQIDIKKIKITDFKIVLISMHRDSMHTSMLANQKNYSEFINHTKDLLNMRVEASSIRNEIDWEDAYIPLVKLVSEFHLSRKVFGVSAKDVTIATLIIQGMAACWKGAFDKEGWEANDKEEYYRGMVVKYLQSWIDALYYGIFHGYNYGDLHSKKLADLYKQTGAKVDSKNSLGVVRKFKKGEYVKEAFEELKKSLGEKDSKEGGLGIDPEMHDRIIRGGMF